MEDNPAPRIMRRAVIIAAGCLVFLFVSNFDTQGAHIIKALFDFGHLPLFGVIALCVLLILGKGRRPRSLRPYLYAWLMTVTIGLTTELLQNFTPERYCEVHDLINDALGAGAFLVLAYPVRSNPGQRLRALKYGALLAILLATTPVVTATFDTLEMLKAFPVLSSFETHREVARWKANDSQILPTKRHATHGTQALELHLLPGIYPGLSSEVFRHDWRGFETLKLDVFLAGETSLPLTLRIDDFAHNQEYTARFNRTFVLTPGTNQLAIDLTEVERAPSDRRMDMAKVASLCLFTFRLETERTLYLDHLRLER